MKKEHLLKCLENGIEEIKNKRSHWMTFSGVTEANLEYASRILKKYHSEIESGIITARSERQSNLSRIVSDSWDFSIPLGETILKAERQYIDF